MTRVCVRVPVCARTHTWVFTLLGDRCVEADVCYSVGTSGP